LSDEDKEALIQGRHSSPHAILGAHPGKSGKRVGTVIRAFHPNAAQCALLLPEALPHAMWPLGQGFFGAFVPGQSPPLEHLFRFTDAAGKSWRAADPYAFLPTVGDLDLHLFGEGNHRALGQILGAQIKDHESKKGCAFSVWAPNALGVSVVGDFSAWDDRVFPMRQMGSSGVWEIFLPDVGENAHYKFSIHTPSGQKILKTDPMAQSMEEPPKTASITTLSQHQWTDDDWMQHRANQDPTRLPLNIYEVHLPSWRHGPDGHWMDYRELAHALCDHAARFGFTHLELMPIAEHPYTPSWGYQVSGYYAPTRRLGTPDDLRAFIDICHNRDIGVILDWVPAHFPKDAFALARFDGTPLFEDPHPHRGEHPDWGTYIFNYGRNEVRNFLLANALFWLKDFHFDGLRVDAVASMLYLDYSRNDGEWTPNAHGGRENLEAVSFLKAMNDWVRAECPGAFTIAEESTAWPGVTQATEEGGLGFSFKWNMGWMHDTLKYFKEDPVHRKHHHDALTFAMVYEDSERFINALSHDEVVHGKGALFSKMPGDDWQKFANLRVLMTYQATRPGKVLNFMGFELATPTEWQDHKSLPWHLFDEPARAHHAQFLEALGALYLAEESLWRRDPDPEGFHWIDCDDRDQSIVSYCRRGDASTTLTVLNLTPVPRPGYRVGVPIEGTWSLRLNTDDAAFGGSGNYSLATLKTEAQTWQGQPHSVVVDLPPMAALVLKAP
jgi:1,4-alpha-glucan branching enzyme